MDWESGKKITWKSVEYELIEKLFQRQIGGDDITDEYHAAWTVKKLQSDGHQLFAGNQLFVLKVIQTVIHKAEFWTEDTEYEWDAGTTGLAKMEITTATRLVKEGWKIALKGTYIQRRQKIDEAYPGRNIYALIFPLPPSAKITTLNVKQLEDGFGKNPMMAEEPSEAYPHAQALVSALRSLSELGYDFHGSYEWFVYDEAALQCYLFDYSGIFRNQRSPANGAELDLTLALLHCAIPRPG